MKKKIDFASPIRHFVGITFFSIIFVTCLQVICRYVFNNSLVWSEELVRFLVVWMCLVGSAVSNFDDDHMTINIIVEKFPRPVQFVVYSIRQLAIIVFCAVSAWSSIPLLIAAGSGQLGALPIPGYAWRAAATVGLALMSILTLLRWLVDLGRFRRGEFCLKDADLELAEEAGQAADADTGREKGD